MHDAAPFWSGMSVPHSYNPTPAPQVTLIYPQVQRALLQIKSSPPAGHVYVMLCVWHVYDMCMSCYEASFPSSPFSVHTSACMMNECLSPPLSRRLREDRDPLLTLPSQLAQKGHFTDTCCIKKRLLAVKGKREGWYIKAFTKSMRKSKQVFQAKHSFSYVLSFE